MASISLLVATYLLPTSAFFPGSPFVEAQFDPAYGDFNLFRFFTFSLFFFFALFLYLVRLCYPLLFPFPVGRTLDE